MGGASEATYSDDAIMLYCKSGCDIVLFAQAHKYSDREVSSGKQNVSNSL